MQHIVRICGLLAFSPECPDERVAHPSRRPQERPPQDEAVQVKKGLILRSIAKRCVSKDGLQGVKPATRGISAANENKSFGRTPMWFPTAGRVPRILHACAVAAGLLTFTAGAQAQSAADKYPDKPIKIIVPFAPGGSADILSRVVGNKLTESFGQTIVVETRPGAGTVIGTTAAAKAEPDGYTLLMNVSNLATNQTLVPNLAYDAVRDFEPISILARAPVTIYVNPKFPPTNIKELIAAAKARPGALNFGSAGPGSMTHLTAEMLKIQAGIEMTHVVYRGGAPALNDVLAGQIPMTFATV
jgi:Tripartite tricarboxylate transporter family receptor